MSKTLTRCPKCNRIGSPKMDGYCKKCYVPGQKVHKKGTIRISYEKKDDLWTEPMYGSNEEYGIIKDNYGIEGKYASEK